MDLPIPHQYLPIGIMDRAAGTAQSEMPLEALQVTEPLSQAKQYTTQLTTILEVHSAQRVARAKATIE